MEISREQIEKRMDFLICADKMKSIYRQTLLADKSRRETDAEHSWHLALMAMVFSDLAPEGVDINRVIKMVIIHDLVEIFAGDTFCYDEKAVLDKAERENASAEKLFSMLDAELGREYEALWREFDEGETPDARFAASLDKLQPLVNNYLTDFHTWKLGNVRKEQVEKRVETIKNGIPELYYIAEGIIRHGEKTNSFADKKA